MTDYSISTVFPKINMPPNLLPLDLSVHKTFDQWQFIIFPKTFKTESAGSGSEAGTSVGARPPLPFVTHILHRNSAEFWPMRHNFVVHSLHQDAGPYLFARFAWAILFGVKDFLLYQQDRHIILRVAGTHNISQYQKTWLSGEEIMRWRITGSIAHEQETARRRDGCLRDE